MNLIFFSDMELFLFGFFVLSLTSNFSAIWRLSPLPVTGLQILTYAKRLRLLAVRDLLRATSTATRDAFLRSYPKDP
jgi:hypothetical protein